MDEISFTGDTYVAELKNGTVQEYVVNPLQFGMCLHELSSIKVADAQQSKTMVLEVLSGKSGAARDIVLLNAGAAIYVAGLAPSLQDSIATAVEMLDSGKAMQKLQELVSLTNA
jgi:anthranilate phosphoribosyltransferase